MVDTSAKAMWTVRAAGRWTVGDLVELRVADGEATVIPRMLPGSDTAAALGAVERPDSPATLTFGGGEEHVLGLVTAIGDPSAGQAWDPDRDNPLDSRVRLTVRAATRGEAARDPKWAWFVA